MDNKTGLLGNISNAFGGRQGLLMSGLPMMFGAPQQQQQALMQGLQFGGTRQAENRKTQQAEAQRNETLEFLQQVNPELAQAVAAGAMSPTDAYSTHLKAEAPAKTYRQVSGQEAQSMGLDPSKVYNIGPDNKISSIGGGVNVNVNTGTEYGPIPKGYALRDAQDGSGKEMYVVPGGPSDKAALQADQRTVETNTIVSAAEDARNAAGDRAFGGVGQGIVQNMPWTDSAEVARKVDVLKAQASVGNLNQMRQSSPTGGALGNVTERELKLLQDKSGALDPSSPNFMDDLNDYELTLLQTIHGAEAGLQIYNSTRSGVATPKASGNQQTSTGVNWSFK